MNNLPTISIIGRTNVGKSTLFNLFVKNKVITSHISGTTRDTNQQESEWQGTDFNIVDTGGIDFLENHKNDINADIEKQITIKAKKAIENSNLVLFLVDAKVGILPQDKKFANFIKENKLNYILIANKCSNKKDRQQADEFYELGLGEPIKISAINGSGVGDMLDIAVDKLPKKFKKLTRDQQDQLDQSKQKDQIIPEKENIKICFIGKTNVGKSSILNSIMNEEKVIVSEIEHTTRDSQFIPFTYKDYQFTLIDTAGVRKKRTQIKKDELEFKSVKQTERAIKKSDIAVLVTDVSKNLSVGDLKFSRYIRESQKGLIIVANKWDLIDDKDLKTYAEYVKYYYITMPFFRWAKIIPSSAKEKIRVLKILDEAIEIYHKSNLEINPEELVNFKNKIIKIHPPTIGRGNKKPKIYKINQVGMNPQTFEVVIGKKTSLNESYLKFIEKKIRSEYNLDGVAVITYVRKLQNTM